MPKSKSDKNFKLPPDVTEIILESISDGVFTVDHNWRIMSFNRAAEEITGISRNEALGKHCWEVFRSNMCEGGCALRKTMEEGKSFVGTSTYIVNSEKKRIPITTTTSPLKDGSGKILGGVEVFRDHSLVEELRRELTARFRMGDMISRSPAMQDMFRILPRISESDSTVLVEGETGTGKELVASAIHNLSLRKDRPFVAINCGALPDTLLESELFGYKAGAFTNAVRDNPGRFAAAGGGTILLDEIGETSAAFQIKLLRVIEKREFQALGSSKNEKADVRIIAATNRNLAEMVEKGDFRRDLFYRINVVQLKLPPLRERLEDIPLLVDHFIGKMNRMRGKVVSGLDEKTLKILMSHDYPGNIRELENIIEHAFILCSEGNIQPQHLPANILPETFSSAGTDALTDAVKSAEIAAIENALRENGCNRNAAAASLGIHKSTFFRKIKALGISMPEMDGRSGLK